MTATHSTNCTASNAPVLYLAVELGASNWKLAFPVGLGQKPRLKTITARSTLGLLVEIKAAKKRFGLPEDAPVLSTKLFLSLPGAFANCRMSLPWVRSASRKDRPRRLRSGRLRSMKQAEPGPGRLAIWSDEPRRWNPRTA